MQPWQVLKIFSLPNWHGYQIPCHTSHLPMPIIPAKSAGPGTGQNETHTYSPQWAPSVGVWGMGTDNRLG